MRGTPAENIEEPARRRIGPYEVLAPEHRTEQADRLVVRVHEPRPEVYWLDVFSDQLILDADTLGDFLQAARTSARIEHPRIVHVEEIGVDRSRVVVAQEFVPSETLEFVMLRTVRSEWPTELIVHIIIAAARAVEALRGAVDERGVLLDLHHGDLSPRALIIGYDGRIRLLDAGIAHLWRSKAGLPPGLPHGTWGYLSPETINGLPGDEKGDLYALGVMAWELLTGVTLFQDASNEALWARAQGTEITRPSRLVATISEPIERAVMRALEHDPGDRFRTVSEFADALRRAVSTCDVENIEHELADWMSGCFPGRQTLRKKIKKDCDLADAGALVNYERPNLPADEMRTLVSQRLSRTARYSIDPKQATDLVRADKILANARATKEAQRTAVETLLFEHDRTGRRPGFPQLRRLPAPGVSDVPWIIAGAVAACTGIALVLWRFMG